MAGQRFQYLVHHPLLRHQLAPPLRVGESSWNEAVKGIGEWNGTIALPREQSSRDILRAALEPDEAAVYIKAPDGTFVFGGLLVEQTWNWDAGTISIKVVSWKSWFYNVFLGPKVDLTGDNLYNWTQVDQLEMARNVISYVTSAGTADGRPAVAITTQTSGKLRDLNLKGLDFKYAAEVIDAIANRSGGFEWDIRPYPSNSDGLPSLRLELGFPELGGIVSGMLLRHTPEGGNMALNGGVTRSSSARRSRVWATGNTETFPFALDSDPDLDTGMVLLRERVTSYSTVTDRTTLSSHARAERQFLNPALNLLSVTVQEDAFDITSYPAGSRCRLVYRDDWYNLDLPAVRIIERKVSPRGGAGSVDLVLDLVDMELPEVDTAGA